MDYGKISRAWQRNPVPKRVGLARRAGLEGRVGSKEWGNLSEADKRTIASYLDKVSKHKRHVEEVVDGHHNKTKPKEPKSSDYVMWVGSKYYPTYHDFVNEAKTQGTSKRIGKVPMGLVPGKSRIFMAHDEGLIGQGFVFGYFEIDHIDVITKHITGSGDAPGYMNVSLDATKHERFRKCGWRSEGGVYLMSPGFVLLKHFPAFKHKHFRGALAVDGKALLASKEFVEAPSDVYKKPKKEPKWTKEEDEKLLKAVAKGKHSRLMACTLFALRTGHSKSSVIYRYSKLTHEGG